MVNIITLFKTKKLQREAQKLVDYATSLENTIRANNEDCKTLARQISEGIAQWGPKGMVYFPDKDGVSVNKYQITPFGIFFFGTPVSKNPFIAKQFLTDVSRGLLAKIAENIHSVVVPNMQNDQTNRTE